MKCKVCELDTVLLTTDDGDKYTICPKHGIMTYESNNIPGPELPEDRSNNRKKRRVSKDLPDSTDKALQDQVD